MCHYLCIVKTIVEQNAKEMETRKKYYMDCHLAGRKYHDADEVWDRLKVGTLLSLKHDKENRHDANAVAVLYKKEDEVEPYCIGYIPRDCNEDIAGFLEMGWTDIFECRISKIKEDAHPESQVLLTIKIRRKE